MDIGRDMMKADARDAGRSSERLGIIGFGPIGQRLVRRFRDSTEGPRLAALLVRPRHAEAAKTLAPHAAICTDIDEFLNQDLDVAVECASPETLATDGARLLGSGCDIIPLSLGAFANPVTERALLQAAAEGGSKIEVPAGALGSIGFLAAARENGLSRVGITVGYPIERWVSMKAGRFIDLRSLAQPTTFLKASAREVALQFPGHMNVITAASLAGLGLDDTDVSLVADPSAQQAWFRIEAESDCGPVCLTVGGRDAPVEEDPIDYTTFSVIRLLRRRTATLAI